MPKFRKKPVVIEAIQWHGFTDGPNYIPKPAMDFLGEESGVLCNEHGNLVIKTLEGDMTVSTGDWIIRGVKGELYPCKPDIFEATYECEVGDA